MKLREVSRDVYVLPFDARRDQPNLYYIRGDKYSVAIDAGMSKRHVEEFYAALEESDLPLPELTILTHWHWDHTFGLHAIKGRSICSVLTQEKLKEVSRWKWSEEDLLERERQGKDIQFCSVFMRIEYDNLNDIRVIEADEVVDKEMVLDLGNTTLRLIPRDSSHSRDSLFILDEGHRIFFVGDADGEDFYDNERRYEYQRTAEMLSFFESLDYDIHCIAHFDEFTKAGRIEAIKENLKNPLLTTY